MLKKLLPLVAAVALLIPSLAQAFEGAYALTGMDPDKSTYAGTVEVLKSGAGYQVKWTIDGSSNFGAAMAEGDVLWVGYVDDGKSGVTKMTKDATGNLKGPWYRRGGNGLGEETWTKK
jgi:hypothetical protein